MNNANQISEALTDVRKAFRLLYGYNRRIRDIVDVCAKAIPEKPFKQETFVDTLTGNRRPIGAWWTWDCIPTFDWTFLFRDEEGKERTKYLFVLGFVADTSLENALEKSGEPDPATLDPAEASRTMVELCLIASTEKTPNWSQIWDQHWIDRSDGAEGTRRFLVRDKDDKKSELPCFMKRFDLSEFSSEASVVSIVRAFRAEAVTALKA